MKRVIVASFVSFAWILLSTSLAGCKNTGDGGGGGAPGTSAQVSAPPKPAPAPPQDSMRVKTGAAPMTFLVAPGGNIRIVDSTSGMELLRKEVAPQTIVSIDATDGIKLGDNLALQGPLPANHKYEIWLDR